MEINEVRTIKTRFTTNNGNSVEVVNVSTAARRNGIVAREANPVRTVAIVNGSEQVEIEAGCAFKAPRAVAAAGF